MSEYFTCRKILQTIIIFGFIIDSTFFTTLDTAIVVIINSNATTATYTNGLGPKYDWTVFQKNSVLGAIYIGLLCSETIGGRICELYGAKRVRLISLIMSSILTIFQPLACQFGFKVAYAVRLLVGLFIGPSLPSNTVLIVNWFAPSERTRSIAATSTFSIGIGLGMQIFGLLLYHFDWRLIFYGTGILGLIWSLLIILFVHEIPDDHPRISQEEKQFIKRKMLKETNNTKGMLVKKLPIKYILTSRPFWVIAFSRICCGCLNGITKFQLSIYMNDILKLNIKENGFYSSLPFLGYTISTFIVCHLADKLMISGRFTRTTVRKIMECSCLLIVAVSMVLLSFWGTNATVVMVLFVVILWSTAFFIAGHFTNVIDIAPNFSGTLIGAATACFSVGVWFNTLVSGLFLSDKNNIEGWQHLFWFVGGFCLVSAIVYTLFANAEVQRWNDLDGNCDEEKSTQSLKNNEE